VRSSDLSIESLSELIEKLDNKDFEQLFDNVDKSRLSRTIVKKKELLDSVEAEKVQAEKNKRISVRLALKDECDYDETKDYTNHRLREQIDNLSNQYCNLSDQYIIMNREFESFKRQTRRMGVQMKDVYECLDNAAEVRMETAHEVSIQTEPNQEDGGTDAWELEATIPFEQRLAEIINEKQKMYTIVKGQKTLSLHSGMILQNLISTCGSSVKKLPHIIGSVLTLFFGNLDDEFLKHFLNAPNTYDAAMTRASTAFNNFNKSLFVIVYEFYFDY
jgi:hypothetical protein